jgi:hypothetical protein
MNIKGYHIDGGNIIPLVIFMFRKKGWRHKCCSKKTFRNRSVFLTTTIKQRSGGRRRLIAKVLL